METVKKVWDGIFMVLVGVGLFLYYVVPWLIFLYIAGCIASDFGG